MHRFRVFLSYAHTDRRTVEDIAELLRGMGLIPVWDKNIAAGAPFDDEIRRQIAQAHIFMPLLTPSSRNSPWVHQEIGYALGIGVPVVPIAIGAVAEGMLAGLQAVSVQNDLTALRNALEQLGIDTLVLSSHMDGELERVGITTYLAEFSEDRTRLLVKKARGVPKPAPVRQRGLSSSFSLPDEPPHNRIWDSIELPEKRSEYLRDLLRKERRVLEEHARSAGCSLLLNPFVDFSPVGARVHRSQLEVLREFLTSMPAEMIRVAFVQGKFLGNLTIIGDWFGAKALPPQPGSEYRQTLFCHHAATVLRWTHDFDQELEDSLRAERVEVRQSRDYTLQRIEERLKKLPVR